MKKSIIALWAFAIFCLVGAVQIHRHLYDGFPREVVDKLQQGVRSESTAFVEIEVRDESLIRNFLILGAFACSALAFSLMRKKKC